MFHVKQYTQPGLRYVTRSWLYFFLLYILYICPAPTPHNQPGWFHSNVSRETYLPSLPGCIPSITYILYYVPLPPLCRPGRENCLARASNSSPYLACSAPPLASFVSRTLWHGCFTWNVARPGWENCIAGRPTVLPTWLARSLCSVGERLWSGPCFTWNIPGWVQSIIFPYSKNTFARLGAL